MSYFTPIAVSNFGEFSIKHYVIYREKIIFFNIFFCVKYR